jgi:hypothetical protein
VDAVNVFCTCVQCVNIVCEGFGHLESMNKKDVSLASLGIRVWGVCGVEGLGFWDERLGNGWI